MLKHLFMPSQVQLLRRVAKFNEREVVGGAPPEQNVRLNIPKKTKLYVDQTTREKEHSAGKIHHPIINL